MGGNGFVQQQARLREYLGRKADLAEGAGLEAGGEGLEGYRGDGPPPGMAETAERFAAVVQPGPGVSEEGITAGTALQCRPVTEDVQQVYLEEAPLRVARGGGRQVVEIGAEQPVQSGKRLSFRSDRVEQFAGVKGMGDALQIGPDRRIDPDDVGLLQTGKPLPEADLDVDTGKRFQGGAEPFAALAGAAGEGLDSPLFQGEERYDPVMVAVVQCSQHKCLKFFRVHGILPSGRHSSGLRAVFLEAGSSIAAERCYNPVHGLIPFPGMVEQHMVPATEPDTLSSAEQRNNELASMIEIGKALTSSLELHAVLEAIMKQVDRLIRPKAWSLLLVDETSKELKFEIAVSPVAAQLKGITLKQGEGIAGWVALHGEPLLIPDVQQDHRFAQQFDEQLSFKTRSIIAVPLKINDKVIGVIELINSFDELIFNDDDQSILTAIADFAAIALVNARNFVRINELVVTDDLTGLYNSRHFAHLVESEFQRALRYNTELSIVFLDLDHLKSINDAHGHLVGSRMLSELGRMIGSNIRDCDRAARYGGDEFVIILPQTDKQHAVSMAVKLLDLMRSTEFRSDDDDSIHLTASFGVATYPRDAADRTGLLRAADIAMYAAKESGRNCVRAFQPSP